MSIFAVFARAVIGAVETFRAFAGFVIGLVIIVLWDLLTEGQQDALVTILQEDE